MARHIDFYYPIRVWFLSIIAGPIIVPLIMFIEKSYGSSEAGPFKIYGLLFFVGFLYSIPSVAISYLMYRYLLFKKIGFTTIKIILIILGFMLFTATFSVIGSPLHKLEDLAAWTLPISYSIFFLLGSIVFKIERNSGVIT